MAMDEKAKLEFEKSLDLRNMEIEYFWKRGWFFGALIIAFFAFYLKTKVELHSYSIYLSFLLLAASTAQSFINRGSKYWQERWEYKVKNRESILGIDVTKTERYQNKEFHYIQDCIDEKSENIFVKGRRFSVSKLAMLVWDFLTIFFFLIWINEVYLSFLEFQVILTFELSSGVKKIIFHLVYIVYFLCFIIRSRMINPKEERKKYLSERINNSAEKYCQNAFSEDES